MAFNINKIFLGSIHKESRTALSYYVRKHLTEFGTVVLPMVGGYATAETIIKSGVNPKAVISSDISLYSTVLGYYYQDQSCADLHVKFQRPELDGLDPTRHEDVLFAIKYAQICKKQNYYMQEMSRDLASRKDVYLNQIRQRLAKTKPIFKGSTYRVRDVFDEIKDYKDNPSAFLFINPPAYKGGYVRMFDFKDVLTWDEPKITQYEPNMKQRLLSELKDAKATVICVNNIPDIYKKDALKGLELMSKLFVKQHTDSRYDYLLVNRQLKPEDAYIKRPYDELRSLGIPIFHDSDYLNKFSKVSLLKVEDDVAGYYRNLFLHKLPAKTGGEQHFLMLIDGKIFAAIGIKLDKATKDNKTYVFEDYCIAVPSFKYLRMNRLAMRFVCSKSFRDAILKINHYYRNIDLVNLQGIKTTCLATHPEQRGNRGLLKLVDRKLLPDNTYYLQYYTDFYDKDYKQMLLEWLNEEERLQRLKKQRNEEDE